MNLNRMKKSIYFPLFAVCLAAGGCTDELYGEGERTDGRTEIIARITEYDDIRVSSRSVKSEYESRITSLYMLVFDSAGGLVDAQRVTGSKPVFVIDSRSDLRYTGHNQALMAQASIWIVANLPEDVIGSPASILGGGYTLDRLKATDFSTQGINLDRDGFPMIGSSGSINLQSGRPAGDANSVEEIPLTNLYAKVSFSIGVSSLQESFGNPAQFTLTGWRIDGIPAMERIGESGDGEASQWAAGSVEGMEGDLYPVTGNPAADHGSKISFSFYMPEHKVLSPNPEGTGIWPAGLPEDQRQRFKPLLADADGKAASVLLEGIYIDHRGQAHEVSYRVFLGGNNYNDFTVRRNHHYRNEITIQGITNNASAGDNISIDHRVEENVRQFAFYVERETQLDAHYEIRPIDIELNREDYADPRIVLEIRDSGLDNWIRMEKSAVKREFFTTDLVTKTLSKGTRIELDGNGGRVWVYADENTGSHTEDDATHSGDGYRYAVLTATFYDGNQKKEEHEFRFKQEDLFPVTYGGNTYNIEHYEEYLYNFDPKDRFGDTTDGFIWGPDTKISSKTQTVSGNTSWDWVNSAINRAAPKYDFTDRYKGEEYTEAIVEALGERTLRLSENPRSAAEYCYNKNKRNASGEVTEVHWYLPAIGEIQEIATGANSVTGEQTYLKFPSFQSNRYWSSQTSYRNCYAQYEGFAIISLGVQWRSAYTDENTSYARATRTDYRNGIYSYEPSEVDGVDYYLYITRTNGGIERDVSTIIKERNVTVNTTVRSDSGNRDRQEVNRVRCVYKR